MIGLQRNAEQERFVDYLAYFGLAADPFEPNISPYFQVGKRRETLSQLLHLCQFSTSALAVVGEAGVGKSCLKQALLDHLDARDIVCEVDVPVLSAADQILKRVIQQLAIPIVADKQRTDIGSRTQTLIDSINQFVTAPSTQDKLKVLLVENAHHLDDAALSSLLKIAPATVQSHHQFHVVLFGEPQLSQRLQNLESDGVVIRQFFLEPLNREELKSYLRFRLNAVGFDGIFPFKEEDIQFLWDISHGLPSALHDAAREILIELATPPPEPKSLGLPVGHMALIIGLVTVLLIAVFYRSEVGDDDKPVAAVDADGTAGAGNNATSESRSEKVGAVVAATQVEENDGPTGGDVDLVEADAIEKQLLVDEAGDAATNPSVSRQNFQPQGIDGSRSRGGASVAQTLTPQRNAKPTIELPPPAISSDTKPDRSNAPADLGIVARNNEPVSGEGMPLTVDEKRLMALAPEGFTLQVLASGSKAAVDAYLLRQSNREDLAVFSTLRDGRLTYIVVAGSFATSNAARQAVPKLPKEQQQAGPWPRSIRSVQADIRGARDL